MQVFKLVKGGHVDTMIGFDSLPESMLDGITRGPIAGWGRHWLDFFGIDSKDRETATPFYTLDYIAKNADRQKWQEISSYVKRNVDPQVRLLDKIEAMAVPVAQDCYSNVTIDPENVTIIPLPKVAESAEEKPKRRGRKPAEAAAAVA